MGKILAVCISEKKGTTKENVKKAYLKEQFGLENDAHGGKWHRQVSLLSAERIEEFRKKSGWTTELSEKIWWWKALIFVSYQWEADLPWEKHCWK